MRQKKEYWKRVCRESNAKEVDFLKYYFENMKSFKKGIKII